MRVFYYADPPVRQDKPLFVGEEGHPVPREGERVRFTADPMVPALSVKSVVYVLGGAKAWAYPHVRVYLA